MEPLIWRHTTPSSGKCGGKLEILAARCHTGHGEGGGGDTAAHVTRSLMGWDQKWLYRDLEFLKQKMFQYD
jgi:hypothetical protein